MKLSRTPIILIIAALLVGLLITPIRAQDGTPTSAAVGTVTSLEAPAAEDGETTFTLNLPDMNQLGWRDGIIVVLLFFNGIQMWMIHGSIPLPILNGLLGLGRGVTKVFPGQTDDEWFGVFESLVSTAIEPKNWPQLITKAVEDNIISRAVGNELIKNIQAQGLNPYQSYVQADSILKYYRSIGANPAAAANNTVG